MTDRRLFEFGPFRLDTAERQLWRDGKPVFLTPTVFEILSLLVRNSGHLIEKDEMLKEIWPDTFVEEASLYAHISALRKALGDTPDDRTYIETVPRCGYRFVSGVRELRDEASELVVENHITSRIVVEEEELTRRVHRYRKSAILSVAALIIVGAAAILGFYSFADRRGAPAEPFRRMRLARLTSTGTAMNAAISPDGKYVVQVVGDAAEESLWLRNVITRASTQLVPPAPVEYLGLAFSRDGNYVYYGVRENNKLFGAIYQLPLPGGAPRKVIEGISRAFSLSPDGLRIAFVRDDRQRRESLLIIAGVDGAAEQILATRRMPDRLWSPAWSPDGEVIAFATVGHDAAGRYAQVVELRVADGTEKRITAGRWADIAYLAWLSDSSGLVMTARADALTPFQIWNLSRASGEGRRITNDLNNYWQVTATTELDLLAAVQLNRVSNIWVGPGENANGGGPVTAGAGRYYSLAWTPQGEIVYTANAGGNNDLWIMQPDGTKPRQLTFDRDSDIAPSVSPDGRHIVFVSYRSGSPQLWRINREGGELKQLTAGSGVYWPQCSPDGRWVVYAANTADGTSVWKVPLDGGNAVPLTPRHAHWPAVSPDGKLVGFFYRDEQPDSPTRIAVVPFEGGEIRTISDIPPTVFQRTGLQWTPDGRALAYMDNRGGVSNIWSQPIDGGPPVQLTDFRTDEMFSFAFTGDGKRLACSRGVSTSDVVLISDFR